MEQKEILIGIDFAIKEDKTIVCILNRKTKEMRFKEIKQKSSTQEQRDKIIKGLMDKYNPSSVYYGG